MGMFEKKPETKKESVFEEKEKLPMNANDLIELLVQNEKNRKMMFKEEITEYGEKAPVIQVNGRVISRVEMKGDIINIVSE